MCTVATQAHNGYFRLITCTAGIILIQLLHTVLVVQSFKPQFLKTPDGFVIDNTLQGSEQEVRLEDFFWTGSGDGAPTYNRGPPKVSHTDHVHDLFVKTSTVLATVYVDASQHDGDANDLCLTDCGDIGISKDDFPTDRRYWLLTVVSGFFTQDDFPMLEKKLAKLYRIAFSRQQSHHFGLSNNTVQKFDGATNNRKRSIFTSTETVITEVDTKQTDYTVSDVTEPFDEILTELPNADSITTAPYDYLEQDVESDIWEVPIMLPNIDHHKQESQQLSPMYDDRPATVNNVIHRVSVLLHNITLISEDTSKHPDNQVESLIESNGQSTSNFPRNQTEIVYSVFVNGKPVLATTAADDMKLLSEDEVADEMEKLIYTKAEPFWKEPHATPLIPSTTTVSMNGSKSAPSQLAIIVQNPWMVSILIATIILLIFLLVGLLFMTRAKRIRSAEVKRLTSSRALISDDHENTKRQMAIEDKGIDNISFERDNIPAKSKSSKHSKKTGTPTLYFPGPPSTSPSTSNSDSLSSYYRTKATASDKHAHSTHKRSKKVLDLEDYATITKKRDRKRSRHKRKMHNRVGSIEETVQVHSPQSSFVAISDDGFDTSGEPDSHFYEHIEAFNPNVNTTNYHKNKLLMHQGFRERGGHELDIDSPNETYNPEIMRALQHDGRLNDSISIGSFLSMGSIRSFPKYNMPEPLSRVLEPLSVTHFDHSDGPDTARIPRVIDTKRKHIDKVSQTVKQDLGTFQRSQSDGADPGVIGPVVWEIHKRQTEAQDSLSPLRDPVYTRNRFEGLLEGAIKMYSDDAPDSRHEHPHFNDVPGAIRPRDCRGKSAMMLRQTSLITPRTTTTILNRPLTAEPFGSNYENTPTEPPSPYRKAWASGAPSPLVRPLSAGPFHRPNPEALGQSSDRMNTPGSMAQTQILSTAPLIEAIQTELQKFDRYQFEKN